MAAGKTLGLLSCTLERTWVKGAVTPLLAELDTALRLLLHGKLKSLVGSDGKSNRSGRNYHSHAAIHHFGLHTTVRGAVLLASTILLMAVRGVFAEADETFGGDT